MRRTLSILVGLVLLWVLGACAQLTPPLAGPEVAAFPGDNGKIVFMARRDGNPEIYVMNADGSDQTNITNHPTFDEHPAWSPDGSQIVFVRPDGLGLFVMDADGSNQTQLTDFAGDSEPAWSPDGTRIVFQSFRDNGGEIYVMDADGTNVTRLTNFPPEVAAVEPAWSPDGTQIAFRSGTVDNFEIFVMNPDGSNQINLTNHPAFDYQPSWSPDGSRIAFATNRSSLFGIYVMNADGSNPTNLTNDGDWPAWSPDGTKIAFRSARHGQLAIWTMNADGTNQIRLTDDGWGPDWQPIPTPLTPSEAIEALMEQIEDLDLVRNTERSLLSLLAQAQDSVDRGNPRASLGKLAAFIHQVEAQSGKKIFEADAEAVIAVAESIVAAIAAMG